MTKIATEKELIKLITKRGTDYRCIVMPNPHISYNPEVIEYCINLDSVTKLLRRIISKKVLKNMVATTYKNLFRNLEANNPNISIVRIRKERYGLVICIKINITT